MVKFSKHQFPKIKDPKRAKLQGSEAKKRRGKIVLFSFTEPLLAIFIIGMHCMGYPEERRKSVSMRFSEF
jgi:hypothetical protein